MTIKEIESRTGLPRASVRFYESEELIHPVRGENGYRNYSQEDLNALLKIKLLRQLNCSLEDIRALQRGERSLGSILEQQLSDLERSQTELDRARTLCEKLLEDRADWAGLEPERYLNWMDEAPSPAEAVDIRHSCPWRRFLARGLDLALYTLLWRQVLGVLLHANTLQRSAGQSVLDTAVVMGLTLLLEPVFLHYLGTTPGKWSLGLRLTRSDGSFFSLEEGFQRTFLVLVFGEGLSIPLVSLFTIGCGYYRCKKGLPQFWELPEEAWSDGTNGKANFWDSPGSHRRAAVFVAMRVLIIALTFGTQLAASTPRHHGALTPEEFAANYNHLMTFASAPDVPVQELGTDGRWRQTDPETHLIAVDLFSAGNPDFHLETSEGVVTAVSFTLTDLEQGRARTLPNAQAIHALNALLGKGEFLILGQRRDLLLALEEVAPGVSSWQLGGWTVTCTLDARGYQTTGDRLGMNTMLFPVEGQPQALRFAFQVQRTDTEN